MSFTKRYYEDVGAVMGLEYGDWGDECLEFGEVLMGLAKDDHVQGYIEQCPRRIGDDVWDFRKALYGKGYWQDMKLWRDQFEKLLRFNSVEELSEFYRSSLVVERAEECFNALYDFSQKFPHLYGGDLEKVGKNVEHVIELFAAEYA
tara:strand:- start:3700 stop:4140 length:441 start_codon:yes stop_codon:yes gene_type:complete